MLPCALAPSPRSPAPPSYRPEADEFDDSTGDSGPADIDRGNVLHVTEENYVNFTGSGTARCGDYEGSFQTWRVPWLDADRVADRLAAGTASPSKTPYGHGTIEPLDRWNTELLDSRSSRAATSSKARGST